MDFDQNLNNNSRNQYYFKNIKQYEKTKFKYIFHVSDIHINLQNKHDEYRCVFKTYFSMVSKILENIKSSHSNNQIANSVMVITGDIFIVKQNYFLNVLN